MVSVPVLVNVWNQAKINSKYTQNIDHQIILQRQDILTSAVTQKEENDQIELIKKAF